MNNVVTVSYDSNALKTEILVNGQPFDISRIDGKEVADWAYPFMIRKVRWNGFYDEMVEALGGETTFQLIFHGDDNSLNELQEAWEDAPVTIISDSGTENIVVIEYVEDDCQTIITVNGQPFDTARIDGKEIADWVYPFMMRKMKWNGIFEELSATVGSDEYTIQFSGSNAAMQELMEECPETVSIIKNKNGSNLNISSSDMSEKEKRKKKFYDEHGYFNPKYCRNLSAYNEDIVEKSYMLGLWYREVELNEKKAEFQFKKSEFMKKYRKIIAKDCKSLKDIAAYCYAKGIWNRDFTGRKEKSERFFRMSYTLETSLGVKTPMAGNEIEFNDSNIRALARMFKYGSYYCSPNYEKAIEFYLKLDNLSGYDFFNVANCFSKVGIRELYRFKDYDSALDNFKQAEIYYEAWIEEDEVDEVDEEYSNFYLALNYYYIAECYEGLGDEEEQFAYYSLAVEKDDTVSHALVQLGCCYYLGTGTEKNFKEAVDCFYRASEQNDPLGFSGLGCCYENGEGVDKDIEKARKNYELGAGLGSKLCEEQLENLNSNFF